MQSKIVASFAAAAVLAACASAPPTSFYVRAGLTVDQLEIDSDRCMAEARVAERAGPSATNDGTLAGAFSGGLAKGSSDMDRFFAAHEACFMRAGYRELQLTPAQQEEFALLRTSQERVAYIVRVSEAQPE